MEQLGYVNYYDTLNAMYYGIPQNRERVFTISIREDINKGFLFPPKQELNITLSDLSEKEVSKSFYLSDKTIKTVLYETSEVIETNAFLIKHATKKGYLIADTGDSVNLAYPNSKHRRGRVGKGVVNTLLTVCNQALVVELNGKKTMRKLTTKEYWRLMGFDDEDYIKAAKVSNQSQLYKQAGNSIVVNVLEAILRQLLFNSRSDIEVGQQLSLFNY
jgi:DNA (cytosine-5)-methyltransferase 1